MNTTIQMPLNLLYNKLIVKVIAVEQWLTRECGIDLKFCAKDVLFGVVEKDNFINSVICYARLYIMKCKIQDKQIAIEGFLNLIENEGVLYPNLSIILEMWNL